MNDKKLAPASASAPKVIVNQTIIKDQSQVCARRWYV